MFCGMAVFLVGMKGSLLYYLGILFITTRMHEILIGDMPHPLYDKENESILVKYLEGVPG